MTHPAAPKRRVKTKPSHAVQPSAVVRRLIRNVERAGYEVVSLRGASKKDIRELMRVAKRPYPNEGKRHAKRHKARS